jgi:hypothetical protein
MIFPTRPALNYFGLRLHSFDTELVKLFWFFYPTRPPVEF